ncbi:hypothetical protein T190115A13A_130036 [Tenacibaculum sp. 190524A02b]|uniref:Uncharacterized protein n=1 Tax=Tenacibaculum vairaonense TaxID=3137860 RepID=A0ABP1F6C5_9FLAO
MDNTEEICNKAMFTYVFYKASHNFMWGFFFSTVHVKVFLYFISENVQPLNYVSYYYSKDYLNSIFLHNYK